MEYVAECQTKIVNITDQPDTNQLGRAVLQSSRAENRPIPVRDAILSKKCSFFNIVQKAFDPPPLLFEHLSYFAGGVF